MASATITNEELLKAIKDRLGITDDFHDATLLAYAEDVKAFMLDGGVDYSLIDTSASVGLIARGVADMWNFGAGDGKLSALFVQRMIQLAYTVKSGGASGASCDCPDLEPLTDEEVDICTDCLTD